MTARDQLIQQHMPLVQAIAGKMKRNLGKSVDFDDLVGYGNKGLIEAAERFDPKQGVSFTTFAYYRVRGAMVDGLRTMGWYSRADYARYRAEERAGEYMQAEADREAAAKQANLAGATAEGNSTQAATLESIAGLLGGIATVHITSLEAASGKADESHAPADTALHDGRMGVRVRQAIKTLPEKERQLMEMYYFDEKNLEEAGAVLGLSKSWACRLHARAVNLLREALGDD